MGCQPRCHCYAWSSFVVLRWDRVLLCKMYVHVNITDMWVWFPLPLPPTGADIDTIISYIFSLVLKYLTRECVVLAPLPEGGTSHLLTSLLQCLASERWSQLVSVSCAGVLLSEFSSLPSRLLALGQWRQLYELVCVAVGTDRSPEMW